MRARIYLFIIHRIVSISLTMIKKIVLAAALASGWLTAFAAYDGTVYEDLNGNGLRDRGEKALAGVAVSDGLNVAVTDRQGRFSLPGHADCRFIFISSPSGYLAPDGYYIPVATGSRDYDFGLTPYDGAIGRDGSHRFIQVTDTEIFNTTRNEEWVDDIRRYAANNGAAFVVHTGDICYPNGLRDHIGLMNTAGMGVPVYYCIGNHDLVAGKYGEELFESIYGPVYYSFNAGGTHYVVTPMAGGDHRPSYNTAMVARWLKNDLAALKEGTPVYFFNHDLFSTDPHIVYGHGADTVAFDDYNVKALIYGHLHINHKHRQGNIYTLCTSTPDKGGIDHSAGAYRVVNVDSRGNSTTELRHCYISDHAVIASPQGPTSAAAITVNAYSAGAYVTGVKCAVYDGRRRVGPAVSLGRKTDWSWSAPMARASLTAGKSYTMRATVDFSDGSRVERSSQFTWLPGGIALRPGADCDNLLGSAAHTGFGSSTSVDSIPALAWTTNIGADIFMTTPLVSGGKIFTASVDEDTEGKAAIHALDIATGAIGWTHPVAASVKNSIAIAAGKVFAQDATGNLYAVDCADGSTSWTATLPASPYSSIVEGLVTKADTLFAGTGLCLSAYDAATGRRLWLNSGWRQNEGSTATLTVGSGVVLGSAQWGALYGNDAATGSLLWSLSDHGIRNRASSPAIADGLAYFISNESMFIVEPRSGHIVAMKKLPFSVDVTSTPAITDRLIIIGTARDGIAALDRHSLEVKWMCPTGDALIYTSPYTRPESSTVETSPVVSGNTVFATASDGIIYAIELATGKLRWRYHTGAPILSSPTLSGNMLIVNDAGGNVYAFGSVAD